MVNVQLEVGEGKVTAHREIEGAHEVVECQLPAVFTAQKGLNEPRYASLKGMMAAKKKPLETLTLSDLGIDQMDVGDAGSRTEVRLIADPQARANATRIEDHDEAARAIVEFLAERQLV